jgi:hypothetical protein
MATSNCPQRQSSQDLKLQDGILLQRHKEHLGPSRKPRKMTIMEERISKIKANIPYMKGKKNYTARLIRKLTCLRPIKKKQREF